MTVVATSAEVRFGPDRVIAVDSTLHLTDCTRMYCHLYPDSAPIVSISDAHVKVSLTVPEADKVTGQDVTAARGLADVAARYVAELERLAGLTSEPETGCDNSAGRAA